jgi:hypothetical protein
MVISNFRCCSLMIGVARALILQYACQRNHGYFCQSPEVPRGLLLCARLSSKHDSGDANGYSDVQMSARIDAFRTLCLSRVASSDECDMNYQIDTNVQAR